MKPMLCTEVPYDGRTLQTLLETGLFFIEQKLDGRRAIIDSQGAIGRDGQRTWCPGAVSAHMMCLLRYGDFAFDGEIVEDRFHVFDLISAKRIDPHTNEYIDYGAEREPFAVRRAFLELLFGELLPGQNLQLVRSIPPGGPVSLQLDFIEAVRKMGGEGVVLKDANGLYTPGVRTDAYRKVKFTKTLDAMVAAVRSDGRENITLALWDGTDLVEVGACSIFGKAQPQLGDVVEIRYLYAVDNDTQTRLVQPRLLRVRDDKKHRECTIDQVQYTNKSLIA